jgi:hypothetical protein
MDAHEDDATAASAAIAVLDLVEHHGVKVEQASVQAADAQLREWGRPAKPHRRRNKHRAASSGSYAQHSGGPSP